MQRSNRNQSQYIVSLDISSDELLKYYRGSARAVIARAENGIVCQFPVDALKPFVTHRGVQGRFVLSVNSTDTTHEGGKLLSIRRLG